MNIKVHQPSTVTVTSHVSLSPDESVTVTVTTVVPMGYISPSAVPVDVTTRDAESSTGCSTVTTPRTSILAVLEPLSVACGISPGHVIVGIVRSTKQIIKTTNLVLTH